MNLPSVRQLVRILSLAILLTIIGSQGAAASLVPAEDDPGSPARLSNLGLAYQLFDDVFNDQDAAAAAALVAEGAVIHTPFGDYTGPDGLLDYLGIIHRGYPDAVFDVDDVSVTDDAVVISWTMTATRYQVDATEPVTIVDLTLPGITFIDIEDARIASISHANGQVSFGDDEAESAAEVVPSRGQAF